MYVGGAMAFVFFCMNGIGMSMCESEDGTCMNGVCVSMCESDGTCVHGVCFYREGNCLNGIGMNMYECHMYEYV